MRLSKLMMFLLVGAVCFSTAPAQDIAYIEYYIDSDPGHGNGTDVTFTADSVVDVNFTADLSGLDKGTHTLYVRTLDDSGTWSLASARRFLLQDDLASEAAANVEQAEYFIDSDPGFGNGTPISLTNAATVDLSPTGSLAGIGKGMHTLYVRTRDAFGKWSLPNARRFYAEDLIASETPANVTGVEYFIDADPGFGNGTPATLTPAGDVDINPTAALGSLPDGFHTLYVRSVDAFGKWSLVNARPFLKSTVAADAASPITRIDWKIVDKNMAPQDSGSYAVPTPAADVDENLTAPLTSTPVDTGYTITLAAVNQSGISSLPISSRFAVEVLTGAANVASVRLDGVGDRVRVVDGSPANPSANEAAYKISGTAITVEAWVYPMGLPGPNSGMFIAARPGGNGIGNDPWQTYALTLNNFDGSGVPKLSFMVSDGTTPGSGVYVLDTSAVQTGQWYHVAGTYDGTDVKLYVNGALVNQAPSTLSMGAGGTGLYLGGLTYDYFNGLIDEVRLWNVTRSLSEIGSSKDITLQGTESGLAGYWPMDSTYSVNSQTATPDLTANKNDLYVQNDATLLSFPQGSAVQIAPTRLIVQKAGGDPLYAVTGSPYAANVTGDGWPAPTVSGLSVPAGATANGDSITWTPADNTYDIFPISGTLTNAGGSVTDTVYLYVEAVRRAENQLALDVANRAKLGAFGEYGKGLTYKGKQALPGADFSLVDRNDSKYAGGLYSTLNSFRPASGFSTVTSGMPGFMAFRNTLDDGWEPNPIGVSVEQTVHYDTSAANSKFVFVEYAVTNTSGSAIDDLFAQMTADFDIGTASNNMGGYDSSLALTYGYEAGGANDASYYGFVLLGQPVAGHSVFVNGTDAQYVRSTANLTAYPAIPSTGSDTRNQLTAGPMDLAAGETKKVMFALVAGDDLNDIKASAQAAWDAMVVPGSANVASVRLDGVGDRVRVVDGSPANPSANEAAYKITGTAITVEAWVYPMGLPGPNSSMFIAARPGGNGIGNDPWQTYALTLNNFDGTGVPKLSFMVSDGTTPGSGVYVLDTSAVQTGQWYHVAGTYDGTDVKLYVNGALVNQAASTLSIGAGGTGLYLGGLTYDYFNGLIDEVRLWNVTRSLSEIGSSKDITLQGTESGLAGYWPMDSTYSVNSQIATPDLTANQNDLYVQNDAHLVSFPGGSTVQIAPTRMVLQKSGGDPLYAVTGSEYAAFVTGDGWPIPAVSGLSVPAGATANGDSITWTPADNTYDIFPISSTLTNAGGSVTDTVYLYVEAIRRAENQLALDIANRAKLGAFGEYGKGMSYKGTRGLVAGDFSVVDRNDSKYAGGLYSTFNSFRPTSGFSDVASPLAGFMAFSNSLDDGWEPNPIGVSVEQTVHYDTSAANSRFVIVEYKVTNTSGSQQDDLFAQMTADFDVGNAFNNLGGYDSSLALTYAYEADGASDSAYYGFTVLEESVAGRAVFVNGEDPQYVRSTANLTTFPALPSVGSDVRNQLTAGPFSMAIGEEGTIAYAFVAGDNLADIRSAAQAAHDAYRAPGAANLASMRFDGIGDRVRVIDGSPVDPSANQSAYQIAGNAITVESWVYLMDLPGANSAMFIAARPGNNGVGNDPWHTYALTVNNYDGTGAPKFSFMVSDGTTPGSGVYVPDTSAVQTGQWYHVAGTYDGTDVKLYVNGALVNQAAATLSMGSGGTGFYIGGLTYDYFNGLIDEVRLWNTTRSAFDIASSKDITLSGTEAGLAGYWPMDSTYQANNAPVTPDLTANKNDLYVQFDAHPQPFPAGSTVQIAPTRLVLQKSGGDPLYAVTGRQYAARVSGDGWPAPTVSGLSVPAGATANGDSITWTPADNTYDIFPISGTLTNTGGSVTDTVYLYVEAIRRAENQLALDVANRAKLGAFGEYGTGMSYKGNRGLFAGDFSLVDRNDTRYAGGLYSTFNSFRPTSGFSDAPSPLQGFMAFRNTLDDGWEPNPIGVSVEQTVHYDTSAANSRFVIVEYSVTNTSGSAIDDLFAQMTADFDVGNSSNNLGGYDSTLGLTYAYEADGANDGSYYGFAVVGPPVSGHAIFPNGSGSQYVRSTANLTSFAPAPTGGTDTRNQISVGPSTLAAGDSMRVWFIFAAGDSLEQVKASALQARTLLGPTTGVEDKLGIPEQYALEQNYPNPFNPSTTIEFSLPAASSVRVEVFNILGQSVALLQEGDLKAGYHMVQWNAQVASGLYFYRIEATSASDPGLKYSAVKKMMLLK